jgi:preprotein translocase subunit YajC
MHMTDLLTLTAAKFLAMAPSAGGADGNTDGPGLMGSFVPMALMMVIFYFILIRPQQKAKKEQEALITNAKSGDDVILNSGFLGTISNVKDKTFVVKIADNVKVEVLKSAIQSVVKPETKTSA